MTKDILVETKSGVATVTFNRPSKRNAIDHNGWLNLSHIAEELSGKDEVKVIIFTGSVDVLGQTSRTLVRTATILRVLSDTLRYSKEL